MVEAATEFRKSGFSDEDAANLALVATMYQNVADESISAADSAGFIIAQMKAFNIEAEDATHIIDAVNEVSNNYAVSSADLADNLGKVSSALAVGGNSFEETLGMMTAITEITRNSSTAARGLVSIQSRFNQIIDETSSTGQKLTAFYDKHGIAIKDQNGQLRNLYDVLKDTAGIWDTLDENEQKYFLNIQAGANQSRNLAALMENFGVAVSATATAMGAAGSAAEENGRVMESLQKKIDNLRAAWENFSNNTITKDFIGGILDAGTQLLTFADTDLGRATVKALLFGTTIGSATGFIGTFVSSIGKAITNVGKLIPMFKVGQIGVAGLFGAFAKPTLTLFALGVAGVVAALVLLNEALGNGESAFDRYMSKAEEAVQEQEEYENKLDDAKAKLEELNKIPYADRTAEQQGEIEYLQDLITKYEELIAVKEREAGVGFSKAIRAAEREGISTGEVSIARDTSSYWQSVGSQGVIDPSQVGAPSGLDALEGVKDHYDSLSEAIYDYANALGISTVAEDNSKKTLETLQSEIAAQGYFITESTESWGESVNRIKDYTKSLYDADGATKDNIRANERYLETNRWIAEALQKTLDAGHALAPEQENWLQNYNYLSNATKKARDETDKFSAALSTLSDFTDGMPGQIVSTEQALSQLVQSLVRNSDLGIQSVSDLRSVLLDLADAGYIDFSNIEGGINGLIDRLLEANAIQLDDKTATLTVDDSELQSEIDNAQAELSQFEHPIVQEIKTVADAQTAADALDRLGEAVGRLEGKSVNLTINAKTDGATTALDSLKSSIRNESVDISINATDNASALLGNVLSAIGNVTSNSNLTVVVNGDNSDAIGKLDEVAGYYLPSKTVNVYCNDQATAGLGAIKQEIADIERDIWVTIHMQVDRAAKGAEYTDGGAYLVNDGTPVNGSAGELVVSDGIGTIYNGGEETIIAPPKGSKIYTASETQQILKDQGLTVDDLDGVAIPAMADGTTNNKYPDYRLDPTYSGVTTLKGSGEDLKKNFDEWLKEKKHFLNMDVITEAQYYRDLEIMNERYLKNMADYRDDYWQHEEEIYNWRNQSLEEQIALEEKLEELAKAKTQKVLTYTGGRFQYLQNIEAIAAAQREVDKITGKYADGTMSARGGLSLVGERGPELRVLKNGDGIIPADATKNLLSLSRFSAKDIIGAAKSNITQYAFSISNISLPNVQSPEDFIDGLRNMAYQYSFTRT